MPNFVKEILLLATLISALGLIYIIYSRDNVNTASRLYMLTLLLTIGYLISHGIHFLLIRQTDVTILDQSCHSFLLMILVVLTFFSYYFPDGKRMPLGLQFFILLPSIIALVGMWSGWFLTESHAHHSRFEAHYGSLYPLFLIWYSLLILVNIWLLTTKLKKQSNRTIRTQILLILIGLIITNMTAAFVGMFLPWIMGFYYLVEISPLAFLVGLILFTALGVGRYDLFPSVMEKFQSFSINKKVFFSALIVVPITILIFQIPISRLLFPFESHLEWEKFFLLSIIGGIIVSTTMAFIIVKVISAPLKKIKDTTHEIQKGNYGISVQISSDDEIGKLAETFNNMSKTLEKDAVELKLKQERISVLLKSIENSHASIAVIDSKRKIIEANNKFLRYHNLEDSKYSGCDVERSLENIPEETRISLLTGFERFEQTEGEYSVILGDGRKRNFYYTLSPVNLGGSKKAFILIEFDVTEMRTLENQLFEAEKFATLGKMAAVLAHEIKTPLTSIKMNSDILRSELTLNDEDRKAFGIIDREINRLNSLVKEVLQYSKQTELKLSEFNINSLLNELIAECKIQFEQSDFKLISETKNETIVADRDKLHQVLLNLIQNSYEARNKNGFVKIQSSSGEGKLELILVDNGKGIPEDKVSNIFEPFFTLKPSGTGLGLAIAKKIIDRHNGVLELISSRPGKTIFRIKLSKNLG